MGVAAEAEVVAVIPLPMLSFKRKLRNKRKPLPRWSAKELNSRESSKNSRTIYSSEVLTMLDLRLLPRSETLIRILA